MQISVASDSDIYFLCFNFYFSGAHFLPPKSPESNNHEIFNLTPILLVKDEIV